MAVSMHGTGTPLGDPIEVGAVTGVVGRQHSGDVAQLALLSNKACFGHSEGAAGLAGTSRCTASFVLHPILPGGTSEENIGSHVKSEERTGRRVQGVILPALDMRKLP